MTAVIQDGAPGLDLTAAIQAAISGHKAVQFPACEHRRIVTAPIYAPGPVSLLAESSVWGGLDKQHDGPAIVWQDVDCQGTEIINLSVAGNGTGAGFWFGSNVEHTSHVHIEGSKLYNLARGIDGDGIFTLFDSYLEKVDFLACNEFGLKLSGSQITADGCTFRLCRWGILVDDQPAGYSIGGGKFDGGGFLANDFDIVIGSNYVRPLRFDSVWFEQSKQVSIGRIVGGEIFFASLLFDACIFQPGPTSGGNGIADLPSYKGLVRFPNCIVYNDLYAPAMLPEHTLGTGDNNALLSRENCARVDGLGQITRLKDYSTNPGRNWQNLYLERRYSSDTQAGSAGLTQGDVYYNTTKGAVSLKN